MPSLRVCAISYLNTVPLMWNFDHGCRAAELRRQFDVDYTVPSNCAQMLAEGSADIGIIPTAAYATIPGLRILPDVAIASKHAVRSILLISAKPIDEIRSVALDKSSRTSAALLKVLFRIQDRDVAYFPEDPYLDIMLAKHDAALLIGDPALQVDPARYQVWDLAQEWRSLTGKPFVYAFWAARESAASEEELAQAAEAFRDSRDEGLQHVHEIARDWHVKLSLPEETLSRYLTHNIHYVLDSENLAGMQLFFRLAASYGILPAAPELRVVPELETRNSAQ